MIAPVEKTFLWRQLIGRKIRDIPITVTWLHETDEDGDGYWVPVKFTIDGGGKRMGPLALADIPWTYIIATTDPDNTAEPETPDEPLPSAVNRRQARGLAFEPEVPEIRGGTSLALIESLLGIRAYNLLRRNGVHTVEAALKLKTKDLLGMEGVGPTLIGQIQDGLRKYRPARRRGRQARRPVVTPPGR